MLTLMFHRVLPEVDESYYFARGTAISQQKFLEILDVVSKNEFAVVAPEQVTQARSVCFSFDDGYADNAWALEQLCARGWPSVVYPVRDFTCNRFSVMDDLAAQFERGVCSSSAIPLDRLRNVCRRMSSERYRHWRGRLFGLEQDACPADLFFSEAELKYWTKRGVRLGIHGVTHCVWSSISAVQLVWEVEQSESWIQTLSGLTPVCVAFPHGKEPRDLYVRSYLYDKLLFGVDRNYRDEQIIRRLWIKEGIDMEAELDKYSSNPRI